MDQSRRDFLSTVATGALVLASTVFIGSCSDQSTNNTAVIKQITNQELEELQKKFDGGDLHPVFQATLRIGDTTRKINFLIGATIMISIAKELKLEVIDGITTIDGISGPWKYSINGIEPGFAASNCQIIDCLYNVTFTQIT